VNPVTHEAESKTAGKRADRPVVAVVAHAKKPLGGGLPELRKHLAAAGFPKPLWYEAPKSKKARKRAKEAIKDGADLVFAWGGDGTVQRCVDALAGTDAALAILPAGTSNLLATSLGIPKDLKEAVTIGIEGRRRVLDTGTVNGEHFAVMAGAGLDALLVGEADSGLKDRVGRAAYVYTGARNLNVEPMQVEIHVDGHRLFTGTTTCVLVGNTSELIGGVDVFEDSRPDDGLLDIGIVTAEGPLEWLRTVASTVIHRADRSPFVKTAHGKTILVDFGQPTAYELDGGNRDPAPTLRFEIHPASITVCVPGD
jgi:diacylglycerol kinase (ATP)